MPKKPKKRSDAATVAARVEEIVRLKIDGAQAHDLFQFASEKSWGLTDRQVRNLANKASELLVERQERKRRRLMALHVARRETLYARAVNAGDQRTALAILDSEAKLQALFPDAKDLREVAKLLAAQSGTIEDLENRLGRSSTTEASAPEPDAA